MSVGTTVYKLTGNARARRRVTYRGTCRVRACERNAKRRDPQPLEPNVGRYTVVKCFARRRLGNTPPESGAND
jgi:hypothetical protein